jgi:TfoX/Sxy family transcriptional regulator of competence genes
VTEDDVVQELRQGLSGGGKIRETRMFGATGFMLNESMVAGTFRQGLLLRVGKDRLAQSFDA